MKVHYNYRKSGEEWGRVHGTGTCIMLHMCIVHMPGQLVDCEVIVHVSAGWRFLSLNEESQWTFALAIKAIFSP